MSSILMSIKPKFVAEIFRGKRNMNFASGFAKKR